MIEMNEIQARIYKVYPAYQKFVADQAPAQLLVNFNDVHTTKEAISVRRLSIKEMNDIYATSSFVPGIDYFGQWLKFFNRFSNINKPLPEGTIQWVAAHLFSKYGHFYFADLKVLFEQILESRFGKFYGSVDAVRILSAFLEYDEARGRILNEVATKREAEYKVWYEKRILQVREEVYQELKEKHPDWGHDALFEKMKREAEIRIKVEAKKIF